MEEKRKEERRKVMAFTPVYDGGKGTILGYLRDLTLHGCMVIGEHCLVEESRLVLTIAFPAALEGITADRMTIAARVARCTADDTPNSFRVGFEFLAVSPDQEKMIQTLLDRFHFQPAG